MTIKAVRVTSIVELVQQAIAIGTSQKGAAWWRGHSDASWKLEPGIFREGRTASDERNYIATFRLGAASRYPKRLPENSGSMLFLMQHYGLPTRLLDWSESVVVAAHFALSKRADSDATIWALNPVMLNARSAGSPAYGVQSDPKIKPMFDAAIRGESSGTGAGAWAVIPEEVDPRQLMQMGRATIHDIDTPALEDSEKAEAFLTRLEIPARAKQDMMRDLGFFGARGSHLFPDLEHLAAEIAERRHN